MDLPAIILLAALAGSPAETSAPKAPVPQRLAVTCFKTGEQTSGMNKICYYDCLGSQAAITIGATQLCPLSIQR